MSSTSINIETIHLKNINSNSTTENNLCDHENENIAASKIHNKYVESLKFIFFSSVHLLTLVSVFHYFNFESKLELTKEEKDYFYNFSVPRNATEYQRLGRFIHKKMGNGDETNEFNQQQFIVTFILFEIIVITHQFCVPFVLVLIVLAGFLYSTVSFAFTFLLVLFGSVIGQTTCFLMIQSLTRLVQLEKRFKCIKMWKKKLNFTKGKNSNFWSYFLFLKMTSFITSYTIDLIAPIIGIPIKIYIIGSFIGLTPQYFCSILTGRQLDQIVTEGKPLFSKENLVIFAVIAIIPLVPVIIKKYCSKKEEKVDKC